MKVGEGKLGHPSFGEVPRCETGFDEVESSGDLSPSNHKSGEVYADGCQGWPIEGIPFGVQGHTELEGVGHGQDFDGRGRKDARE